MNPNRSTDTPGLNLPQYAEGAHGGGYVNVRPVYNSHPPGRPVLDKRAPRAGHRVVSRGYRFGPAMGHLQGCSISTRRLRRPPVIREWKGGAFGVRYTRQPRLSAPFVRMTSPERVKVYPCYLQSAAWFVV